MRVSLSYDNTQDFYWLRATSTAAHAHRDTKLFSAHCWFRPSACLTRIHVTCEKGWARPTAVLKVTLGRRAQPTASPLAEQNQRLYLTREFSAHSCLIQRLKHKPYRPPIPFFHPAKAGKLIHGPVYSPVEYTVPATRNTDQGESPSYIVTCPGSQASSLGRLSSASTHWPSQASGQTVASPQRDRNGSPRLPRKPNWTELY